MVVSLFCLLYYAVDSAFDDEWKLEVEDKVLEYSKQNLKDLDLDKEIEESEIVRCINKLKIIKLEVVMV